MSRILRGAISVLETSTDPEATEAVLKVLTAARVQLDPRVPSAWIRQGETGVEIRIGASFAERWLCDPVDAAAVLAHEACHFTEGHVDMPVVPGVPRHFASWAIEIPTNARVVRSFLPNGAPILRALYPLDRIETCMLRPPQDIIDHMVSVGFETGPLCGLDHRGIEAELNAQPQARARLGALVTEHFRSLTGVGRPEAAASLYLDGWTIPQDALDWVMQCKRVFGHAVHRESWCTAALLGEHTHRSENGSRRWLSRISRIYQSRDRERELDLEVAEPPQLLRQRFMEAMRPALEPWQPRAGGGEGRLEATLVPHPGRRELFRRAVGVRPLTYQARMPAPAPATRGVHLYPDSSMSMLHAHIWYPALAQLLGSSLVQPIWSWSGQVRPVTLEHILRGHLPTDGWTRFEPVVHNALRRGHRRLLVVTDGEFAIEDDLISTVREAHLEIVFLLILNKHSDHGWRLGDIASHVVEFVP